MDAIAYFQDRIQRKFIQLNSCIIIKTAKECLLRDKTRFYRNLDVLCGANAATTEQVIILETEVPKMLVIRGGDVVFHYEDGIDAFPTVRSRTTGAARVLPVPEPATSSSMAALLWPHTTSWPMSVIRWARPRRSPSPVTAPSTSRSVTSSRNRWSTPSRS